MKNLVLVCALLTITTAYGQKIDFSEPVTQVGNYTTAQFMKAWNTQPTCVKNGAKVIARNKLYYKTFGPSKTLCSPKQAIQQHRVGRVLNVFKVDQISDEVLKELAKQKKF